MKKVNFVNRENLKIARENVGLDTVFVSRRFNKSGKDVVLSWESGEDLPTWRQANVLAKAYGVPELLFFSQNPIRKNKAIPDYRVFEDVDDSEKVKKLVNFVIRRQEWLEQKLKEDGSKNTLQGSGKGLNPGQLASFIKEKLKIDLEDIKKITGANARRKVLKYLIEKAEDQGIFVGKTVSYHNIEVKEMRGLFISNDYCPFIVINRKDALSAQIFSFIHELAHLFRKTEAISNSLEFRTIKHKKIDQEEIFCNSVAAELLLPKDDFTSSYYDKNDIDAFSEVYKVSPLAIFYRLKWLNKIPSSESSKIENLIRKESEDNLELKRKKKKTGGNYLNNMKDSNGDLFNKVVAKYYYENKVGYTEASNVLRFSVEDVWQ